MIATAECRVAKKRYHHDEQEVARVKEVQVDHRAITLKTNVTSGGLIHGHFLVPLNVPFCISV